MIDRFEGMISCSLYLLFFRTDISAILAINFPIQPYPTNQQVVSFDICPVTAQHIFYSLQHQHIPTGHLLDQRFETFSWIISGKYIFVVPALFQFPIIIHPLSCYLRVLFGFDFDLNTNLLADILELCDILQNILRRTNNWRWSIPVSGLFPDI